MRTITSTGLDQETSEIELVSTGFRDPVLASLCNRDFDLRVYVSEHAQDRWHERVHPRTTRRQALIELVRALETGGFRVRESAPHWKAPTGDVSPFYLMVGSEIALPVGYRYDEPNAVEAITCLTPMGMPLGRGSNNRHPRRRRR